MASERVNLERKSVGPRGPADSPFVIVGEAPGKEEIKFGYPFIGPSGQILDYAMGSETTTIKRIVDGYQRAQVSFKWPTHYPEPYITNTYKYLITEEKDTAFLSKLAMECRPALLDEIRAHPRKLIIASGSVALQALTGNTSLKITQVRGTIFPSDLADIGILATVHPAYLLRGNGSLRQFRADMEYGIELAQGFPTREWKLPTWSVVQSLEELNEHIAFMKTLPPGSIVAGDIETTGFRHREDKILSHGYTWDGQHVYIVNGYKTDAGQSQEAYDQWRRWSGRDTPMGKFPNLIHECGGLWDNQVNWAWHNGKFDVKFFHAIGQVDARVDEDTMLMSYSLDERRGLHDLETVSGDYLNSPNWKGTLDELKKKKSSYDIIPWEPLFKYQAYDIANTFRLASLLKRRIEQDPGSRAQYHKSLIPASKFLAGIEKRGMLVDDDQVRENDARLQADMIPFKETIKRIALECRPGSFHGIKGKKAPTGLYTEKIFNSPVQLAELIFDDLKLKPLPPPDKPWLKIPNIRSTNDDILDKLEPHPLLTALRQYRNRQKAYSTYVVPYTHDPKKSRIESDGRIHTTYLIHGTATGRLSSRDPNVQNIPRDPALRGQFISGPGRMFIECDLNQAELRSLACLSGDPELVKIYVEGGISLHDKVRLQIFGDIKDYDQATLDMYLQKWFLTPETRYDEEGNDRLKKEMKMVAKNVNFGIIYGITEAGLSEQTGTSKRESREWLDTWARTFPVAWEFINSCRQAPLLGKNLITAFGYRKRFEIVTPETINSIGNEAANMPHQSTASLITMHGGIRTQEDLRNMDVHFENTVHDSLLANGPHDEATATATRELVCKTLEQIPIDYGLTRVPFIAEAEYGHRWGSTVDWTKYDSWPQKEAA